VRSAIATARRAGLAAFGSHDARPPAPFAPLLVHAAAASATIAAVSTYRLGVRSDPVLVLGGGITGVGVALALAARGIEVTLVDQDAEPLNRASLRNEGKIHLGLIYANDTSFATARMQLAGALCFRSLLRRWVGSAIDGVGRSTPFLYVVAEDSLRKPDELQRHYEDVEREYSVQLDAGGHLDYLGARPERLHERIPLDDVDALLDTRDLVAAYRTAERAIDTDDLARVLRAAVRASERVRFLGRHKVEELARGNGGFQIEGSNPEGTWRLHARQVVNALWEQRIRFDRMAGLERPAGWVYRLKYRVIAELPAALRYGPSVTMVLGPYGDVVVRPNGTAYLSWYPAGLRGWTHEEAPPAAWDSACRGEANVVESELIASSILQGVARWYPGMAHARPRIVDAGAIVAYGRSDIGDAASGLHDRTRIGVTSVAGFHSIDPGKLTTAPLFAEQAAARIAGET
jgi:glycine/D-amino acid oxidase-like deaminating enzyme